MFKKYNAANILTELLCIHFPGHGKSLDEFAYSDVDIGDIMTSCTRNVSFLGLSGHVEFDSTGEPTKNVKIDQIQSKYWLTGNLSQLMRLWYLSHRRPAKAQASLRIRAVSPEPSLFAHIKYGSRRRIRIKIRHLAPLDGCTCAFEEWVYGGRKVPNLICLIWRLSVEFQSYQVVGNPSPQFLISNILDYK